MKTICDNCDNYSVSPGGCSESCWEYKDNPFYLTRGYFEDRSEGNKKSCKAFKKIFNRFKTEE